MTGLSDEIIAVIVGLVGGLLGYAFREYRNRVTPLFEVIKIMTTSKRSEKVSLDSQIIDMLRGSFYVKEVEPDATLGSVFDTWDRCDDLQKVWPDTKKDIEAAINAASDDDFKIRLAVLLRQDYFSRWLIKLLINSKLDFNLTSEILASQEKVHTWFEEEDDQRVWFDLPPAGESFGQKMGHAAIRAKCDPFIAAVSRLHRPGIMKAFRQFIQIFDADYTKALGCVHELKRLDNENERWVMRSFLANTSNTPIVIEQKSKLTLLDGKTRTKYQEDCYLAVLDKDGDIKDTDTPLIVGHGEGKTFALLTSRKQKEMELGSAVRELYDRGDGKCHVSIIMRRPGLFRRQTYRSSTVNFSTPKKEKE